ncbi:MAG TPA: protein kinase [Polyangia bacterium]|nr:protein kinase [Polyangia bacterium]
MMEVSARPAGGPLPELLAGRYRPVARIGRGAIAEVWRAADEQTGQPVALKVLHAHLRESAVVVERFRREVEIVRRIAHPHVLANQALVETEGLLFLVMDHLSGGDLAERLARRGRLPPGEVVGLARQLCGALAAAHRAGVVHRDVKPSNVLCGAAAGLDVRLCDFGLARTTEASGLTVANAVLGTPEYMAPEVIAEGEADPRSDIYSLGVVLFEAATGRLPFHGDSPYQLMRQHLDVEAPRARSLVSDLPPVIDDAIARALAKDPLDRFATAEDLAAALEQESAMLRGSAPVPARRACPACGGWLVEAAATCADCGARALRLEWQRRGVSVLVTGPGKTADALHATAQAAIYRLLDEAGEIRRDGRRLQTPRLPFYVARGLTLASARHLVRELRARGLEARVVRPTLFGPAAVRDKVGSLFFRYCAVLTGGTYAFNNFDHALRFLGHGSGRGEILGSLLTAFLCAMAALAARSLRPLVARPSLPTSRRTPPALGPLLPRLKSRQDRRLLGRLLDRLAAIQDGAFGELAGPLDARAALAASGLIAVEHRRSEGEATADPARAQAELRREEQARVLFRRELLRVASRLDRLALLAAREQAPAPEELGAVRDEVDALSTEIEAHQELQEWLRPR